jgi:transposase-like protein
MIKIIKEWQESGITLSDFAKKKGITRSKLHYWLKTLFAENYQVSKPPVFFELGSKTPEIITPAENTSQVPGKLQIELTFPSGLCLKIFG